MFRCDGGSPAPLRFWYSVWYIDALTAACSCAVEHIIHFYLGSKFAMIIRYAGVLLTSGGLPITDQKPPFLCLGLTVTNHGTITRRATLTRYEHAEPTRVDRAEITSCAVGRQATAS